LSAQFAFGLLKGSFVKGGSPILLVVLVCLAAILERLLPALGVGF
jgi:hypothetical protein